MSAVQVLDAMLFLSTPSVRRATQQGCTHALCNHRFLSTPSVRRATLLRSALSACYGYFYPRPP